MARKNKASVAAVLESVEADAAQQFEQASGPVEPKWPFDAERLPMAYRQMVSSLRGGLRHELVELSGADSTAVKLLDRVIRSVGAAGRSAGKSGALVKRAEDKAARVLARATKKAAKVTIRKEKLAAQIAKAQTRLAGLGG